MSQWPPQEPSQYQPSQWQGQPSGPLQPNTSYQQPSGPQYPPQPGYTQYPPSHYQQSPMVPPPPPPQPPRKKLSRRAWIIIGVVVLVLIVASAANANKGTDTSTVAATATPTTIIVNSQATIAPTAKPTPKPTPTHVPKWTTFQTFTGTGEKTTATFRTSGDWKIIWTATALSDSEAFFGVSVYGSDGSLTDSGADATIPAGQKSSDSTDEHTGAGSFYLKVYAGIPWTIMVQQME